MVRVGKGRAQSLEQSIEDALQAVRAPQLIFFVSKAGTLERAAKFLAERFPAIPTLGFCSLSLLHDGIVEEPDILVVSFEEEYRVACGVLQDLSECPVQHIYQFQKDVESVEPGEEDTVCLEYCTDHEEVLVTTLNAVLDRHGIPLIGATVLESRDRTTGGHVAYCGEVYGNAGIYAVIRCEKGKVRTYYENIYMRTELTLHQVTKSDVESRSLIEIDGRPAADVYCDIVQVPREEIAVSAQRYPLGRVLGSKIFVAGVSQVMPDGTLQCYKRINPNDAICFMDYGRYREVAMETLERVQRENKNIYFTLTSECIHRYLLYQSEHFWEKHAEHMSQLGTHVGTISMGEQFRHQHINQSLVLAVFSYGQEKEGIA